MTKKLSINHAYKVFLFILLSNFRLVVDKDVEALSLAKVIKKACGNNLKDIEIFDVYEGKGVDSGKKSVAYSLTFSSQDKTLTDEEINPLFEKIIVAAGKEFGAMLRQ